MSTASLCNPVSFQENVISSLIIVQILIKQFLHFIRFAFNLTLFGTGRISSNMESNAEINTTVSQDNKHVLFVVEKSVNSIVLGWKINKENSEAEKDDPFFILQMYSHDLKQWKTKYWYVHKYIYVHINKHNFNRNY